MLFEYLFAAGGAGARAFSSVPYTGNGGVRTIETGVDANTGCLTMLKALQRPDDLDVALYDTVRGSSSRSRIIQPGEDIQAAIAFSGTKRVFTGSAYNELARPYVMWNFGVGSRFFDVRLATGGGGAVTHALGETPALVIILRRSGTDPDHAVHWRPGDSFYFRMSGSALEYTTGTPLSAVSGSSFTLNSSIFPSGNTYLVLLFGTGAGHAAAGTFVGATPAGTANVRTITVPFVPKWFLAIGSRQRATVVCPGVTGLTLPDSVQWAPVTTALMNYSALNVAISGQDLQFISTSPADDGKLDGDRSGEVYMYLAVG